MSRLYRLLRTLPAPLRAGLRNWTPPALVRLLAPQPDDADTQAQLPPPPAQATNSALDGSDAPTQSYSGEPNGPAALRSPQQCSGDTPSTEPPPTLEQIFCVLEVDDAEPLVGDLFRRRFHTPYFPDEPRHFVALATLPDGSALSLGYVHYTMWQGCALCGGLVIDDRHYRRLPTALRRTLQAAGGVAELLLRRSFDRLPADTPAIWGHVGDRQSEKVCLRVGFERTDDQYLLAVWRDTSLDDTSKRAWVERVSAITPF